MQNRRLIAAAGFAVIAGFLALLAWRAAVWHDRGWTGIRYIAGLPAELTMPVSIRASLPPGGSIDYVVPHSPAERAGLRRRDVIQTVDGIGTSDYEALLKRGTRATRGETIEYRILRDGKPLTVRARSASPLTLPIVMTGVAIGVVMMFAFLSIALFVLWHRPRSRTAIVFFWFCVSGTAWAALTAFIDLDVLTADGIHPSFGRIGVYAFFLFGMIVASVMSTMVLHLALVFPRPLPSVEKRPWLLGWMHALPIFVAALPLGMMGALFAKGMYLRLAIGSVLAAIAVYLLTRLRRKAWVEQPAAVCAFAMALLFAVVMMVLIEARPIVYVLLMVSATLLSMFGVLAASFLYTGAAIVALVSGYRRSTAEEKRQLRWPLWGTTISLAFSIAVALMLFIPDALGNQTVTLFVAAAARLIYLLIPLTFAFAILKYRLMDIDVVIKKTVTYSIATGLIVGVFFLLVAGIGSTLTSLLRIESQTLTVVATLSVAALFVPLRNRVQRAVERRFFQRRYDATEAQKLIQQEIVSTASLDASLPRICEYIQQALQVRSVILFAASADDESHFRPAAMIGVAPETVGKLVLDRSSIARIEGVAKTSELRLSEEERARVRRVHAELVAPLALRGRARGVMLVGSMLSGTFDEDDHRFVTEVAQQIAFALEKLTATEEMRDYERALEIQRALLPKSLPRVGGVDIDAVWHPARTVGGDYYDVLQLGPNTLGFCIGDVAGKGMPAALLMANLQAAVKASASAELSPSDVCAKVGTVVNGTLTGGRFVTFFFAMLDTHERLLRYTNAGHNPPLLLRTDGTVERLSGGGPAFARLMQRGTYETLEARLQPGDKLVLFTDGVTEARDGSEEEFGETRLLDAARVRVTAAETIASVVGEVQRFGGGAAQDDLTLVVLRVTPSPNPERSEGSVEPSR